jgi:large subunit GTPase 1
LFCLFVREIWAEYFTKKGIRIAFWSAVEETERQEKEGKIEKEAEDGIDPDLVESDSSDGDSQFEDESDDDDDEEINEGNGVGGGNVQEVPCETDRSSEGTNVKNDILASDVRSKLERNTEYDVDDIRDDMVKDNFEKQENCEKTESQMGNLCKNKTEDNSDDIDRSKDLDKVNVDKSDNESCTCDKTERLADSDGTLGEHVCSAYSELKKPMAYVNTSLIHTGPELLELFKSIHLTKKVHEGLTTVGMVGIYYLLPLLKNF